MDFWITESGQVVNEATRQLIEQTRARKEGIFSGQIDLAELSLECLCYMYRPLFLFYIEFYIEARPELGYALVDSEVCLKKLAGQSGPTARGQAGRSPAGPRAGDGPEHALAPAPR